MRGIRRDCMGDRKRRVYFHTDLKNTCCFHLLWLAQGQRTHTRTDMSEREIGREKARQRARMREGGEVSDDTSDLCSRTPDFHVHKLVHFPDKHVGDNESRLSSQHHLQRKAFARTARLYLERSRKTGLKVLLKGWGYLAALHWRPGARTSTGKAQKLLIKPQYRQAICLNLMF